MPFDFPSSPVDGTRFTPPGGPTYIWTTGVWKIQGSIGAPGNLSVGDNPPPEPQPGQMWWESDTGNLFAYINDGDSSQWVQINVPANNQVTRETFDLTGKGSQTMIAPSWAPSQARLTGLFYTNIAVACYLQVSADGTTFEAGATNYGHSGFYRTAGGTITNIVGGGASSWPLDVAGDTGSGAPHTFDTVVGLYRGAGGYCSYRSRGGSSNSGFQDAFLQGNALTTGSGPIKALRWVMTAGTSLGGKLTVEWLP